MRSYSGLFGLHRDPAVDVKMAIVFVIVRLRGTTHKFAEFRKLSAMSSRAKKIALSMRCLPNRAGITPGTGRLSLRAARAISPHGTVRCGKGQLPGGFLGCDDPLDSAVTL